MLDGPVGHRDVDAALQAWRDANDTLVSVRFGLGVAEGQRASVREHRAHLLSEIVQGRATEAELDDLPSDADLDQAVADATEKVAAAQRLVEEATQSVAGVARANSTDVLLHADKLDDTARRKAQSALDRLVEAEANLRDAESVAGWLREIATTGQVVPCSPLNADAARRRRGCYGNPSMSASRWRRRQPP